MAKYLDLVPDSGIIRIRDLMYTVKDPFRLDQGDVSFDAPDTLKRAMRQAIDENRTHYLQTTGVPHLLDLLAEKLRRRNGIPIESPDELMVANGGIHGLYLICQALFEPGDEVILPDPEWPPALNNMIAARATPVLCPLHASCGWRYDLDELASRITPRTRAIYLNSPHNPTGGVLTRDDLQGIADLATAHDLWVISDEAYEDILYDGAEHVSIASFPGLHERTFSLFTFSKTYAITGLRFGYVAVKHAALRDRMKRVLFLTTSNVSSVVQYGAIGALEGSHDFVDTFRAELQARRDLFYRGMATLDGQPFTGTPPKGSFFAFLKIDPAWQTAGLRSPNQPSLSWAVTEYLIEHGRIGSVPGVDFGPTGEGHIRFCFARERAELEGALSSMRRVLEPRPSRR